MTGAKKKPLKVRVLDDDAGLAEEWAQHLGRGAREADVPVDSQGVGDNLKNIVALLDERARLFRANPDEVVDDDPLIDGCDVLVIDADLRDEPEAKLATGQDLAYAARCFADVGCVVVLNARGENPFDLTLKGNWRSFADVQLGSDQLGNPGLWRWPIDESGFRPWHWPLLGEEARLMRERMDALRTDDVLDQPIVEALGLEASDWEAIPRGSSSFLTAHRKGTAKKLHQVTFMEFVSNGEHGLQRRDGEKFESSADSHREVAIRVAAARAAHWVNGILATERDVLADGPHIAARYPSQLQDPKDPAVLDRSARLDVARDSRATALPALGFKATDGPLAESFLHDSIWAGRPLWWGRRLEKSSLPEAVEPWTFEPLDHVFLEDESRFAKPESAREFACNIESPFRIRYVSSRGTHSDVTYRPDDNFIVDDAG
jgi:hypothetical protein